MHAPTQTKTLYIEKHSNRQGSNILRRQAPRLRVVCGAGSPNRRQAGGLTAQVAAWFVELVLPTGDSKVMAENLQSVAATL